MSSGSQAEEVLDLIYLFRTPVGCSGLHPAPFLLTAVAIAGVHKPANSYYTVKSLPNGALVQIDATAGTTR